jgi:uncharacterized membrane protein YdjX (TVP38/TMEM64 family)
MLGVAVVVMSVLAGTLVALNAAALDSTLRSLGPWAAPAFVCVATALVVFLFSGTLVCAASGLLFGVPLGTFISIISLTAGGTLSSVIARAVGTSGGATALGTRVARWARWIEVRGFRAILLSRLVPGMPFNTTSYAAGVTTIRMRAVLLATAIGIAPRAFALTAVGDAFRQIDTVEARVAIGASIALIGLALLLPPLLRLLGYWPPAAPDSSGAGRVVSVSAGQKDG